MACLRRESRVQASQRLLLSIEVDREPGCADVSPGFKDEHGSHSDSKRERECWSVDKRGILQCSESNEDGSHADREARERDEAGSQGMETSRCGAEGGC